MLRRIRAASQKPQVGAPAGASLGVLVYPADGTLVAREAGGLHGPTVPDAGNVQRWTRGGRCRPGGRGRRCSVRTRGWPCLGSGCRLVRRMSRPPQRPMVTLGPLESEVMQVVWRERLRTVAEVTNRINATRVQPLDYRTVLTVMSRLAKKKLLRHRRQGNTYHFTVTLSEEEFGARQSASAVAEARRPLWRASSRRHIGPARRNT